VVKPAVGAGSRATRRHARTAVAETAGAHAPAARRRRSVLLQPYLEGVDRDGETAVIHIGGASAMPFARVRSAAARGPPTGALFAPEEITARTPEADELIVAQRVLAALPFGALLYARVDLDPRRRGRPVPAGTGADRAVFVFRARAGLGAAPGRGDARTLA